MAGTNFLNYISNFFLISLAITFFLIVFLIYHYKQRIAGIEQKVETMFGIVNSVVKEIENIKEVFNNMFSHSPAPQVAAFMPKPLDIMPTIPEGGSLRNSFTCDDDDEEDDDDEDDDDDDEDDEDDEDDDDEDIPPLEKIVLNTTTPTLLPAEEELISTIKTFDIDEQEKKSDEKEFVPEAEELFHQLEFEREEKPITENVETIEHIESQSQQPHIIDDCSVVEHSTPEKLQEHHQPIPPSTFSKLSIGELKKLANQIQPSLDVSKMKKHDLIKLLER